jgi:hypothetical protein
MVGLIIAFPAIVAYDKPEAEGSRPTVDLQQMLKDDAKNSEAGGFGVAPPATQQQDDDALMKSLQQSK